MVPRDAELIVVAASDGYEREAAELLASVGLEIRGFLSGGMTAWRSEERPVERIEIADPEELGRRLEADPQLVVLDVRDREEFESGHIPGSVNVPYGELPERLAEVPSGPPIATVCSGGKRSGLAASILQRQGIGPLIHVAHGGVGTWRQLGRPLEPAEG